MGYDLPK
jgi:hypothetical protein